MMIRDNKKYFYHKDHLGSKVAVTDQYGKIVEKLMYSAFGELVKVLDGNNQEKQSRLENSYTYTGREFDDNTELFYYRARYYDASVKRFIQQDPIGLAAGDLNVYRYVRNNPINFVDPTGMTEADVQRAIQIVNPHINLSNTTIRYADLGGGSGIGLPATPITSPTIILDMSYLGELDAAGREDLLDTVYHEGLHTQETWGNVLQDAFFAPVDSFTGLTENHTSIYKGSNDFSSRNAGFMNTTAPINRCGF